MQLVTSWHLWISLTRRICCQMTWPRWPLHASWPDIRMALQQLWRQIYYGWHGETPRITLGKSCSGNTGCSWPGISGMLFLKKIVHVSSQQKCTAHFGVPVPLHPSTQTAPQAVQQSCHHQKGYGCSPTMEHLSTAEFVMRIDEDWWYSPRILLNHWTSKTDQHTYLVLLECSTLVHDSWFLLLPLSDHKTTRSLFFSHHM